MSLFSEVATMLPLTQHVAIKMAIVPWSTNFSKTKRERSAKTKYSLRNLSSLCHLQHLGTRIVSLLAKCKDLPNSQWEMCDCRIKFNSNRHFPVLYYVLIQTLSVEWTRSNCRISLLTRPHSHKTLKETLDRVAHKNTFTDKRPLAKESK